MKYPCNLIKDLLPLYIDDVCSGESKEIIQKHLSECEHCRSYYEGLLSNDGRIEIFYEENENNMKIASLRSVKKKIQRKQILISAISILFMILLTWSGIRFFKSVEHIVEYDHNLSVLIENGNIIGRLYGTQEVYVRGKNISFEKNGEMRNVHLFYVSSNLWNDIVINESTFSEFMLCPSEKGADVITQVYYYTGGYEDIESMDVGEIQSILDNSILLWEKE